MRGVPTTYLAVVGLVGGGCSSEVTEAVPPHEAVVARPPVVSELPPGPPAERVSALAPLAGDLDRAGELPLHVATDVVCDRETNPLRGVCHVDVAPGTAVSVTFAPVDGSRPPRTHASHDVSTTHAVPLYLMTPDTRYTVSVRRADGLDGASTVFETGPAPDRRPDLTATGQSSAAMFGAGSPCGNPVVGIFDAQGDLLWIQQVAEGATGRIRATSFTEDRTVLSISSQGGFSVLSEYDLAGRELRYLREGIDHEEHLHHDAFKQHGLVYALANETVDVGGNRLALLDGFYVFDDAGVVAEWWLSEHWTPPSSLVRVSTDGKPQDVTHANSLWVDEQGDIYLSLRHLHSVVKVRGLGPSFGEIAWVVAGGTTPWRSDFEVIDLEQERLGFYRQHNVHRLGTGELVMFDNRFALTEPSRLLVLDVDGHRANVEALDAYDLPLHCEYQGGAWFTAAGNPVATCSPVGRAYEYARGVTGLGTSPAPAVWEGQLVCRGADRQEFVPRFVPLDW